MNLQGHSLLGLLPGISICTFCYCVNCTQLALNVKLGQYAKENVYWGFCTSSGPLQKQSCFCSNTIVVTEVFGYYNCVTILTMQIL